MKNYGSAARRTPPRRKLAASACFASSLAFCLSTGLATGQTSDAGVVAAQLHTVTPHLVAYAQVEPITVVPVEAAETGVISGLNVVPGTHVRAGQEIAQLSGPTLQTQLMESEAGVRSARSQLRAAQKLLAIERQQLPSHLTTRQAVEQAESAQAQAQAALNNAQSRLGFVRQMMAITAPAGGVVLALTSANGQLVNAGQPVLTLQPDGRLWLRAGYYGRQLSSLRTGMTGRFTPSDGSAPIRVRVCSIPGVIAAGGGESIALCSTQANAAWMSGEAGKVTLELPQKMLVAVPTRALILNQGKWWVMVRTAKGDRPQQVAPGPAEGWNTLIESGLAPGARVIVTNAYLLFHASIAEQFQIPD
jgi:cobalt-zinc-cadmium efflux system membrane fusion protein